MSEREHGSPFAEADRLASTAERASRRLKDLCEVMAGIPFYASIYSQLTYAAIDLGADVEAYRRARNAE